MYSLWKAFFTISVGKTNETEQEATTSFPHFSQVSKKIDDSIQLPTHSDIMPSDIPSCIT